MRRNLGDVVRAVEQFVQGIKGGLHEGRQRASAGDTAARSATPRPGQTLQAGRGARQATASWRNADQIDGGSGPRSHTPAARAIASGNAAPAKIRPPSANRCAGHNQVARRIRIFCGPISDAFPHVPMQGRRLPAIGAGLARQKKIASHDRLSPSDLRSWLVFGTRVAKLLFVLHPPGALRRASASNRASRRPRPSAAGIAGGGRT
jgi:hypothetical protein